MRIHMQWNNGGFFVLSICFSVKWWSGNWLDLNSSIPRSSFCFAFALVLGIRWNDHFLRGRHSELKRYSLCARVGVTRIYAGGQFYHQIGLGNQAEAWKENLILWWISILRTKWLIAFEHKYQHNKSIYYLGKNCI